MNALTLPLMFEAAFLAVSTVMGMAFHNLRKDPREKRAIALVAMAGALAYYAAKKLNAPPDTWLMLAPAGVFFLVIGYYAGVGFQASRRPSMEEQIRAVTGEQADWNDLRPHRNPHRWGRDRE